jgi:putative transposase
MARLARLSVGGYPHLVAHLSGARPVLLDDEDGSGLFDVVRDSMAGAEVSLHGYALLPQGIWLLATPIDGASLGRAMQAIGRRYVRRVNDRRGERGSLFGARYRAAVLEPEAELLPALRYVELRPVMMGLTTMPADYRWSSCRHHVGLTSDQRLQGHALYWALGNTPFERQAAYRRFLEPGVGADEAARFERALAGGWVVGSRAFLQQIAHLCPRRPQPSRAGRPRRDRAAGPDL